MAPVFGRRRERFQNPEEVADLRRRLARQRRRTKRLEEPFDPEKIVWVFGAGRTGSTWLSSMMSERPGTRVWFEPQLGELFDPSRFGRGTDSGPHFVFADEHREAWLASVGRFVLEAAAARFPEKTRTLVVKEPHGSSGAPGLAAALPKSAVAVLLRDPRDAIASALDARERGIWKDGARWRGMYDSPAASPDAFVREAARSYLRHVGGALAAYDAHPGRKALVRYEDLRADALGSMRRLYESLGIPADEGEIARAVERHAWGGIPEERKGEGKFYRKATPGGWREDLTTEQVRVVEEITAPLLSEFYRD